MKHIELAIKPALMLLLRDKFVEESSTSYTINTDLNSNFYRWLYKKELISEMEYERLIKDEL